MVTNIDVCILNAVKTIWTTCPTGWQDDCDIFLLNCGGLNFDLVEIDENMKQTNLYSENNDANIDDGDVLQSDQTTEVLVVDASVKSIKTDEQTTEVLIADARTFQNFLHATVERDEQTTEVLVDNPRVERDEDGVDGSAGDASEYPINDISLEAENNDQDMDEDINVESEEENEVFF